ncbi:hypothetical protein SEUCBS139899_003845 [Sporothrix eucalyptigena]
MIDSPPPTPPARHPKDGERRFEEETAACEWAESYRPGKYHPVDLGDVLVDDRFTVVRKLGYGSFSTVWLAHDSAQDAYVALKILVAKQSGTSGKLPTEAAMYRFLEEKTKGDPNKKKTFESHFVKLLSTSTVNGPNGTHTCLAFEPTGPTVNDMLDELPEYKSQRWTPKMRYPVWMAKQILRGVLEALQLLHANGVVHGDVQPGNMLFSLKEGSLDKKTREELSSVKRTTDDDDDSDDNDSYFASPLADCAEFTDPDFNIKLADLGAAYVIDNPPSDNVTPVGLRAPELIFGQPRSVVDPRVLDVWAIGCLLFGLVTGQRLFCVSGYPDEDDCNDDHLQDLSAYLGPLPDDLFSQWKRSHLYFRVKEDGTRVLYNCQLGGIPPGGEAYLYPLETLEEMFDKAAPEVSSSAEALQIKQLILRILQYDPEKRPTVTDILQDAWFTKE